MMHNFQVYKEFFPDIAVGYEDPRVTLHVRDGIFCLFWSCAVTPTLLIGCFLHMLLSLKLAGIEFLKSVPKGTYDAIVVDAFDPLSISLSLPL